MSQSYRNHNIFTAPKDHIFGPECRNSDVYSTIVDPIVKMFMDGYNGLIIAYGQTSSGEF